MTTAFQDYQRFVQWFHAPERGASEDARRFANVVFANFPDIANTSRQRSQRSFLLAALARQGLASADITMPVVGDDGVTAEWSWSRLSQLSVGPFRGFRLAETFELQKRVVMFYGPNGSGKTSLCEALEFALLGSVDEGDIKRISIERYLANSHEGRFSAPVLTAIDSQGAQVAVTADADAYRFCFLEKNRIDSFSRIAAKPAGQKTELIAALFGMDQFNDFVGNFNESMEGQLKLAGLKRSELEAKRASLSQDLATVANEPAALQQCDQTEREYAARFAVGYSYADLLRAIGSPQSPGRLQELDHAINQPTPVIYGVSSNALVQAYRAADASHANVTELANELALRSQDVSYQELYSAVLGLQPLAHDRCPACDTPLQGFNHVLKDPYAKATQGLAQLRELIDLQQRYRGAVGQRSNASAALELVLNSFARSVGATPQSATALERYLVSPGVDVQRNWWVDGYLADPGGVSLAQQAVNWAERLEQSDAQARTVLAGRQLQIDERNLLNQARLDVAMLTATRHQVTQGIADARARVSAFDVANAQLIDEVAQEALDIARDSRINVAYNEFIGLLRVYRTGLPGTLMAGLNALAMSLYNEFNVRDLEEDKLAALHLPVTGEERIELSFRGAPERRVDALQILSEGHVRCLGLAILLAKGLAIRAPVIIFDDAINAIDHEHRQGIREAIFQSDRFVDTQVIVTCHSNEFIKDIKNHVDHSDWVEYIFRHHNGNYHPRVVGNATSHGYLASARQALDIGNERLALGSSRQALELLTERVWKWLGRNDLGLITLKIAGSGAEPALRTLCEGLRARLRGAATFDHPEKAQVIGFLELILGIPEQSLVWGYLNKGTHEEADREDFDAGVVEDVVRNLEVLNALRLR